MPLTAAYAAATARAPLAPFAVDSRAPGPKDVAIDILHCGVCHSDIHQARAEWGGGIFPMVPGHEIVGRVAAVGAEVRGYTVGDTVGVGCMVDSCRACAACGEGLEQYCERGFVGTYNGRNYDGTPTYGGYAKHVVVDESFVLRVPKNLDLAAVAPLLCAGITTWSPLRHWGVGKGHAVGIVGLGGLGHMAVKFARAFGTHVVLFTTSEKKRADAMALGAHEVVVSTDKAAMKAVGPRLDFILDCVSAPHDLNVYLGCLKREGTMTLVGVPDQPPTINGFALIGQRRRLAGSLIGGIAETQEMLDFCGEHGIVCEIEPIAMEEINTAYERMLKSDVRYRFVIDLATLPETTGAGEKATV